MSCEQISAGFIFDPDSQACTEICGDGKNMGIKECDDGNGVNGDGCSSECKVETGWACENGTASGPDACKKLFGPVCQFTTIDFDSDAGIATLTVKCDTSITI